MRKFSLIVALSMLLTTGFTSLVSCNDNRGHADDTTKVVDNQNETPDVDQTVKNQVEELLASKKRLKFNDDGSFRVLILADLHITAKGDFEILEKIKSRIRLLVDREDPNLVIFTGDNTIKANTAETLRNCISEAVGYIEQKQIPWCHVYGNHDFENALPLEQQQAVYESFEYCISKDVKELSGVGNYVNGIYNKDGSLGAVIYCLDSGDYAKDSSGKYDYIKQDQIDWYKNTSELLQEYNSQKTVPALMAFHIPLLENAHAYENRNNKELVLEYNGNRNEDICSSKRDTNLFETALERGDVKAIVTGHDHVNDYMFNYKGIKLASSPNFSEYTYGNAASYGARVFDLNLSTINNVPTYVSYINERVSGEGLDAYKGDVELEYTDDQIQNAIIQKWNGGALTGSVSLALSADKGVNNSSSLTVKRDSTQNFEFLFNITNKGKLGELKYLVVWADFSKVEFRKACFGLVSANGTVYRTDDSDYRTPLFYLADGTNEWVTLSHGNDGCFGTGDSGSQSMKGKKGYFAVPVGNLRLGEAPLNTSSVIAGFYFYGSLESDSYLNVPFYLDGIKLVKDYKSFEK